MPVTIRVAYEQSVFYNESVEWMIQWFTYNTQKHIYNSIYWRDVTPLNYIKIIIIQIILQNCS